MNTPNPTQTACSAVASPPGRTMAVGQFLNQAQRLLLSARFVGHTDLGEGHRN